MPLLHSRTTVLDAASRLSLDISHPTCSPACAPFTPSKSGQRSHPTYYRGCWHVVSRCLFLGYRHLFLLQEKRFTTHRAVIPHAAWLDQISIHCPIFLTAASRRSLDRVSVPVWGTSLSGPLNIVALVGRYPTNWLMLREPIRHLLANFL